jgi:hypothetical protein
MNAKNAAEFTKEYISKTHHFPSRQDVWDAATEAAKERFTTHNSDYAKFPKYVDIANISGVRPSDIKKVCDAIKQLSKFA